MKFIKALIFILAVQVAALADNVSDLMGLGMAPELASKVEELYKTTSMTREVTFSAGYNVRLAAFVPTMAATPAGATNYFAPGLNVVPTAAANTAAFIGAATPVVGQQFRILNNAGASVRAKAAGGATLNGATAGGYIVVANGAALDCFTKSTTDQVCIAPVLPTPAGP